ncbi:MAG: hypothetical protein AB4290_10585 [Spirulina sp.]
MTERSPTEKEILIAELRQLGIKHSPEQILQIVKTSDGKIVFLETGNPKSGLQHILENHASQFADQGMSPDEIPSVIMIAITQGEIIGLQGKRRKKPRAIYKFTYKDKIKYLAIQIAENGYIVSANPRTSP